MDEKIIVEQDNGIATVYLNNPASYNSFDLSMMTSFAGNIVSLSADKNVKGILISGKGKAFCTGGDLKWGNAHPKGAGVAFHELSSRFHQAISEIHNMGKPVIAAINGIAAGGGFSLALACDFRIIAKNAVMKQGYTSSGLTLDGGGTQTLSQLVGLSKAMEIIAFDEPIPAEKALVLNLVNAISDEEEVMTVAKKMLQKIFSISLFSFGYTKRLLHEAYHHSFETQLEAERVGLSACAESPEGMEAMKAFLEKRKPNFVR